MAVYRKLTSIPYKGRPKGKRPERAKKVKALEPKTMKIVKRKGAREYLSLGDIPRADIPGTIKGFRQANRDRAFQVVILEGGSNKNVIGRSHFVAASTTLPEAVALQMIEKYKLPDGNYRVVLTMLKKDYVKATVKSAKKVAKKPKVTRKPTRVSGKKVAKPKAVKLSAKKVSKKAVKKVAKTTKKTVAKKAAKKIVKKAAKKTVVKKVAKKVIKKKK